MKDPAYRVLFVCTGNLCRSPLAEALLKEAVYKTPLAIRVESAGLLACEGEKACLNAQIVASRHGLDLSTHRARLVRADLIHRADLILGMEKAHVRLIRTRWPAASEKTELLKAFGPDAPGGEVADPLGGDLEWMESCYEELACEIRRILPEICARAKKHRALRSWVGP